MSTTVGDTQDIVSRLMKASCSVKKIGQVLEDNNNY